jgi:hypothetical protein
MTRAHLSLVFGILVLPSHPAAQTRALPPLSPGEQVRSWYQQFLHREMDGGASRWINDLQRLNFRRFLTG